MEGVKSFFDSFKEFIWDIIGYFLPGSLVLILLSAVVKEQLYLSSSLIKKDNGMFVAIFIILSYLIGYLVYGMGVMKEKWRDKKSYTKKIEAEVPNREAFKIAKEFILQKLAANNSVHNLSVATTRDVRNIAMGFAPEADQKIYTFMFRSELSNHIANINFLFGVIGWILSIADWLQISALKGIIIFQTGPKYVLLYTILIGSYYILRQARDRFYSIAIGLPFSILVAKILNKP